MVRGFRDHPGLRAKSALGMVTDTLGPTDWLAGPGDDTAVVESDGRLLLAAGEAIWPPFVQVDPFGAGVAAVLANVNDVAAMGGRCLGLVDTVVGDEPTARRALEGLRLGSGLYDVPVLGGHLTVREGPPALSAFALGTAVAPLSAGNAAPGQVLLAAYCLQGRLHRDFPFFASHRERGARLPGDVELLARLAEAGDCVAAKDVSMAGLLGSLAMLLEPTGVGVAVELGDVPRPAEVPLATWTAVFPAFGFLLCAPPDRQGGCVRAFAERGLACRAVGVLDDTGALRVRLAGEEAVLLDPTLHAVTRLGRGTA